MKRRMYKSNDKMILGVCSGIAEFFNIDPVIVRLIMVIITIGSKGTGILIYLIGAIIIPNRPYADDESYWEGRNYRNANEKGSRWSDERNQDRWEDNRDDARNLHVDESRRHSDEDFDRHFGKKD